MKNDGRGKRPLSVSGERVASHDRHLPVWMYLLYVALGAWAIWGLARVFSLF
ncbi:MAG: hypothetical protein NTW86_10275 [Candidatus Sumerlaeota bacterium]|nr:hypothetical protein [Candidatus Sumerlaeota bacterium]